MSKYAIVLLSDTEGMEGLGKALNAIMAVKELSEANETVQLIFSGAGTKWIPVLQKEDHPLHGAFNAVKSKVKGACAYCAGAFKVDEDTTKSGFKLLEEYGSNMSYLNLYKEGYTVLTF
ncbi:MAG: hypothetical protein SFU98_05070 [Leptospiraceae bacterium]|nr:hypothetical protein [Leptospiraceae bacterium]